MADSEFEEFRRYFEELPQHIKASTRSYTLVHDVAIDEECVKNSTNCDWNKKEDNFFNKNGLFDIALRDYSKNEKVENRFPLKRNDISKTKNSVEKRRRKLIQPWKNKRVHGTELKKGLGTSESERIYNDEVYCAATNNDPISTVPSEHTAFTYLTNALHSSPESELCDSGNSTAHSPDVFTDSLIVDSTNHSTNGSFIHLELLEATHRALHKFIARHSDELELEIGDAIYVQKEAEDLWCEGINLRNGMRGIFPSAYVVDVEYNDFDAAAPQFKRERFLLTYLGSIETLYHKGNSVLCQAVHKIISTNRVAYQSCILEVSDRGLKIFDRLKSCRDKVPTLDYFYSLKNVSFCGFYPQDSRFMGFITKHPHCDRFACHVFQAEDSTQPITESIGRAFQRFYQKYIETAYPTEDIYIE